MSSYIAIIHKDPGSDFSVSFPDFPGCVTAGSTVDEAKEMAFEALRGHIEVMREYGEEIPGPSNLEAVMASPEFSDGVAFLVTVPDPKPKSVRVNIMVPEPELKAIDAAAKARGMSRSSFLVHTAKESIRG